MRWRLELMEYDYEICYKAGKTNEVADCLSRIPYPEVSKESMPEMVLYRIDAGIHISNNSKVNILQDISATINVTTRSSVKNKYLEFEKQSRDLNKIITEVTDVPEDFLVIQIDQVKNALKNVNVKDMLINNFINVTVDKNFQNHPEKLKKFEDIVEVCSKLKKFNICIKINKQNVLNHSLIINQLKFVFQGTRFVLVLMKETEQNNCYENRPESQPNEHKRSDITEQLEISKGFEDRLDNLNQSPLQNELDLYNLLREKNYENFIKFKNNYDINSLRSQVFDTLESIEHASNNILKVYFDRKEEIQCFDSCENFKFTIKNSNIYILIRKSYQLLMSEIFKILMEIQSFCLKNHFKKCAIANVSTNSINHSSLLSKLMVKYIFANCPIIHQGILQWLTKDEEIQKVLIIINL
ncbi:uncharacterized protein LOC129762942 isoform X2 [Toxorhynchites rutilus septentrionalis]|uniref:uncharacterized protein LOC129762942 isoform X2 n=1 Tax=Toxorhynchites rutilus septentrionalis TaxID=329112 RepID=UPI002478C058|nr:uncharacterized protein LOC129762942 isoform X2 [Toxorhynchites rutilus septentrionalis]